ncbi:MAG: DIP1984 family protein [Defluviitaleaceae bacterium]|nr:DIP1984 family protein [Defluviitaleaceae bacterium]MCL2240259.1 DIP1984 family protein [Defluviitaleaceae bacterium]
MKLAEALIERAELQKENAKLLGRIKDNTMVQDGDAPAEEPEELIAQYERNMERFLLLVQKINETNSKTAFAEGMNIADAIALRDCLGAKHRAYQNMYSATTISVNRYSQNEIKFVRCLEPKMIQKRIDKLAKEYRELDTKLQGINWTVDLV